MASDERHGTEHSFGIFKPVGHVVISFPSAGQADAAARALEAQMGLSGDALRRLTDREMLAQTERDLAGASPVAAIGQEMNLARAHQALAGLGYHWLVVRAEDEDAARAAQIAQEHGAERAQAYGRFIIEELIEHPGDEPQRTETPDRGLDAQTPSGTEEERAKLRPPPEGEPKR